MINAYFLSQGSEKSSTNHNVYLKRFQENFYVIITLYVDDLILVSNDLTLLKEIKGNLSKKFEMMDL
jgi:pantothenate kinase-related protein Tda10